MEQKNTKKMKKTDAKQEKGTLQLIMLEMRRKWLMGLDRVKNASIMVFRLQYGEKPFRFTLPLISEADHFRTCQCQLLHRVVLQNLPKFRNDLTALSLG